MELAMLIGAGASAGGGAAAAGTAAAAAGTAAATVGAAGAGSILWAPVGMTVAEAMAAGIPLTAATTGAAGAGSLLGSLSTGLSIASMASDLMGGIMGGAQQSEALKMEARSGMIAAKNEEIRGKQEANDIMDNMIQTIASQRLAFAGAGVDSSFGSAAALQENTRTLAERQLDTSRMNTNMAVLSRRAGAYGALSQRGSTQMQSVVSGAGSAAKTLTNMLAGRARRG